MTTHTTPPMQLHPTTSPPHRTTSHSRPHTRPSGGQGWRSTRTDLKHVEDGQARTRVPREGGEGKTTCARVTPGGVGGVTTHVRVNQGGWRPWRVHIFEDCRLFFSL